MRLEQSDGFQLIQIRVACSTMKMSSFPLEIVKNEQAMKSYTLGFYSSGEPEIEEILDGSPIFVQPTSLVFFSFLVEIDRDRGIE